MEPVTIEDIVRWTGGILVQGDPMGKINAVSTDSRKDCSLSLFVPLKGNNFDGHDFINSAVKKGAIAYVSERAESSRAHLSNISIIKVEETLSAFQNIARGYRSRFSLCAIAVTGSNGKTTTKEYIKTVASSKFTAAATEGTRNNHVGVPESILSIDSSIQVGVFELGMSGLGEIRNLAGIVQPKIGVVTNICHVHTEFLKSLDDVANAKSELLEMLAADGIAVLNADDAYFNYLKGRAHSRVVSFGIDKPADISACGITSSSNRVRFEVSAYDKKSVCRINAAGRHNVYNALAAIAAGLELRISLEDACKALSNASLPAMRFQIEVIGGVTVINDAYNANPSSTIASIDALESIESHGRRIIVLGNMLELGWYSDEGHRLVGKRIADSKAASLVTVGELAGAIADSASEHGFAGEIIKTGNASGAADILSTMLVAGDIILIKASRAVKLENIIEIMKRNKTPGCF